MEPGRLRADLLAVGMAAVAAVDPAALLRRRLTVREGLVAVDGAALDPPCRMPQAHRVAVVGGGKAAAAMAAAVARLVLEAGVPPGRLSGLVSVPEGSGRSIPGVEVRETRPAGVNLPTERAVAASRAMLSLVRSLGADDLVFAVISGGGSALLASPRPGVPLAEKAAVAAFLAGAGAGISEINLVRRAASEIKGGGLARACAAGRMIAVVLSDVIGDPLESIASGPCLPGLDAAAALDVLDSYGGIAAGVCPGLVAMLEDDLHRGQVAGPGVAAGGTWITPTGCRVDHLLLGSNATAVEAAAAAARGLGYRVSVRQARPEATETADEVGARLAREGLALAATGVAGGIVEGGEAVVRLPAGHGLGGRNQQTVAAALRAASELGGWPATLALASLGTDGEDGPTTAAGGIVDAAVAAAVTRLRLDVARAVGRCDAHPLLAAARGLIETGPTGTNVADIRILLSRPGA